MKSIQVGSKVCVRGWVFPGWVVEVNDSLGLAWVKSQGRIEHVHISDAIAL